MNDESFVVVARVLRPRGLRGEVVAEMLTDFPERFDDTTDLAVLNDAGKQQRTVELEAHWFQKNRVILKLKGFDSIEAAEQFVGCQLAVPETECVELEEDEFYDWQLEGCAVETVEGQSLGRVGSVLHTGGVPILVIKDDLKEHLIPLAQSICVEVDVDKKIIRVDAPEGLLEL